MPIMRARRPLFRKKVNVASRQLSKLNAKYGKELREYSNNPDWCMPGELIEASLKTSETRERLEAEMRKRKTGIRGATRMILAPKEVRARLAPIRPIRDLRSTGYIVESRNTSNYGEAAKLLEGIVPNQKVRLRSIRGNTREGRFIGTRDNGRQIIFLGVDGAETRLRTHMIDRITKI